VCCRWRQVARARGPIRERRLCHGDVLNDQENTDKAMNHQLSLLGEASRRRMLVGKSRRARGSLSSRATPERALSYVPPTPASPAVTAAGHPTAAGKPPVRAEADRSRARELMKPACSRRSRRRNLPPTCSHERRRSNYPPRTAGSHRASERHLTSIRSREPKWRSQLAQNRWQPPTRRKATYADPLP
jgi:hypothetical protein